MSKRRLPIPLILLLPLLLLALVIVAGVYRFSMTDEEIGARQGWHKPQSDEVMLTLFSYQDASPWQVNIPESNGYATLSEFVGEDKLRRAKGRYQVGEQRGEVLLDYFQLQVLNFSPATENMTFVVPYIVTSQGSGSFYYLGLFRMIESERKIEQLDSVFIGDRLANLSVSIDQPFDVSSSILVDYLTHGESQAMAEKPNTATQRMIKVSPHRFEP